jgi:hypothetical protein
LCPVAVSVSLKNWLNILSHCGTLVLMEIMLGRKLLSILDDLFAWVY